MIRKDVETASYTLDFAPPIPHSSNALELSSLESDNIAVAGKERNETVRRKLHIIKSEETKSHPYSGDVVIAQLQAMKSLGWAIVAVSIDKCATSLTLYCKQKVRVRIEVHRAAKKSCSLEMCVLKVYGAKVKV